jgi:hypothetical protein
MTQAAGTYPLDRHAPDNLGRMVWISLGVHLVFVTVLFVLPREWFAEKGPDVMKITIALGGGAEKTAGGQTSVGSRAIPGSGAATKEAGACPAGDSPEERRRLRP